MSNTTRKLNKFKVTVAIVIIVLFVLTVTGFGRFLYNSVRDRYLASKNFYFTSNLLTTPNKTYEYDNWDGYGVYKIEIDLFSKDNDLQVAKELNYEAAELQNTYDNTTQIDTIDRGLKNRQDLYVLNRTNMPAVLVEVGYMTNPSELKKLNTDSFQSKVAQGITQGVVNVFK